MMARWIRSSAAEPLDFEETCMRLAVAQPRQASPILLWGVGGGIGRVAIVQVVVGLIFIPLNGIILVRLLGLGLGVGLTFGLGVAVGLATGTVSKLAPVNKESVAVDSVVIAGDNS